jgi:hypothetical protein
VLASGGSKVLVLRLLDVKAGLQALTNALK